MPRPKLLRKATRPVPEWSLTPQQLKTARPLSLKPSNPRERLKITSPRISPKEIFDLPVKFSLKDLLEVPRLWCRIYCPPRYRVRKNQKNLTPLEWARFLYAIDALADAGLPLPVYQDFVAIHERAMHPTDHTGHAWGAHTMPGHDGRNFLPWHREYLAKLEAALQAINPLVSIPYWNWVEDRAVPPQLAGNLDLADWGITRGTFNASILPDATWINAVMQTGVTPANFTAFSQALEPPHGRVHNAVGGTMATGSSPADPLFWLHHAFVDKLWADWQAANPGAAFNPPNMTEVMQPSPIMTRSVAQVLNTRALGYVYAG